VTPEQRTALTYRYEKWRALAAGVLETAGTTFLLLIAVRWFQAGALAKALVATGASVGLILAPVVVSQVERRQWPTARAAAWIAMVGAAAFSFSALFPVLPVFIAGAVVGLACASALVPLLTHVYQQNYPESRRGLLFSRTVMVRIAAAVVFGELAGRWLSPPQAGAWYGRFFSGGMEHFRWLLVGFAAAHALAAYSLLRVPSIPLSITGGSHPFKALRYVRHDRLFRMTLISWMFLGFGNLMMVPLRVEYLANTSKYGVTLQGAALSAGAIALLTSVLPNLARLLLNPLWGWLFDRMNFFVMRITLNLGFMLGILSFFTTGSFWGLIAGAIFYGVSIAGGDVAWSLWVTKFAPPERVADYMAVHTFFTGVRGAVAPVLAFQAAGVLPLSTLGWFSAALVLIGTLLLVPEIRHGQRSRPEPDLAEEI
jgi:MFS family permease